ncbi:hypothetical protein JCM10296v2_001685 [Rhodotorula toruloides]
MIQLLILAIYVAPLFATLRLALLYAGLAALGFGQLLNKIGLQVSGILASLIALWLFVGVVGRARESKESIAHALLARQLAFVYTPTARAPSSPSASPTS